MKTSRVLQQRFGSYQQRESRMGAFLGNAAGVVRVAGRDHYVYARLWSGELIQAFNGSVQAIADLPVTVVYRAGRYAIAGARNLYDDPTFSGLPDGAQDQLQWPSPGALFLREEQFLPGLILPAGGLLIQIYGVTISTADGHRRIPTQTYDLSSYLPVSGARYALVEFSLDGDVQFSVGAVRSARADLTPADIPLSSAGTEIGAIILEAAQSEIKQDAERQDIIGLRFFRVNRGGQDVALVTTAFDKILSSADTSAQKAFNTLDEHTHNGLTPATTAANDFLIGNGAAWLKKTLAETIAILRGTLDGVYAALSHTHAASALTSGTLDGTRLPALSASKPGGAPATGTPGGLYLRDDNSWAWPGVTIQDADGTPSVAAVKTIIVSSGTLTDDGGGQVTISTGGGGGGALGVDPIDCTSQVDGSATHFHFSPAADAALVEINGLLQKPADVTLDGDGLGVTLSFAPQVGDNLLVIRAAAISASSGHVIQADGSPLAARANLNFIGATLADNALNNSTDVTITTNPTLSIYMATNFH